MENDSVKKGGFDSLKEFYPHYLQEHNDIKCRRLHFVGTSFVFLIVLFVSISGQLKLLLLAPVAGYGFSWIGHFLFERNKPAAFKFPFYSLASDFIMYFDILRGKVKI